MAFELPKLSYIDTRWEEPAVQPAGETVEERGLAAWIASYVAGFRAWRADARSLAELRGLTERELSDMGLNAGDVERLYDARYNQEVLSRSAIF